jgi:hypothetical protein
MKSQQSNKPFCSVCKNAGKTEKEYTNHYTKSSTKPDAVVTCPTILNSNCTYCKLKGHFKSNCSLLKEKESILENKGAIGGIISKKQAHETKTYNKATTMKAPEKKPVNNIYNILQEEIKPKQKKIKTEDYPELIKPSIQKTKITEKSSIISYAEKAAFVPEKFAPPPSPKKEPELTLIVIKEIPKEEYPILSIPKTPKTPIQNITLSYAKKLAMAPEKKPQDHQIIFKMKNINIRHRWDDDNYWNDEDDEDDDMDYDTHTTNTRLTEDTYEKDEFYERLSGYNDPFWSS